MRALALVLVACLALLAAPAGDERPAPAGTPDHRHVTEPGISDRAEGWADRQLGPGREAAKWVVLGIVGFLVVAALALALASRRPSAATRFR